MMLCGWIGLYLIFSRSLGYRADNYFAGLMKKDFEGYKARIADDLKDVIEFKEVSLKYVIYNNFLCLAIQS